MCKQTAKEKRLESFDAFFLCLDFLFKEMYVNTKMCWVNLKKRGNVENKSVGQTEKRSTESQNAEAGGEKAGIKTDAFLLLILKLFICVSQEENTSLNICFVKTRRE